MGARRPEQWTEATHRGCRPGAAAATRGAAVLPGEADERRSPDGLTRSDSAASDRSAAPAQIEFFPLTLESSAGPVCKGVANTFVSHAEAGAQ
jgi:hypothetical protein